jgi:phage gp36-like protein
MSSYATTEDLLVYGLSEEALSGTSADAVQQKLDAASAFADSYLGRHYTLPLSKPYPISLIDAVCRVAAYNFLSVRGFNPQGQAEEIRLRYLDASEWMKDVGLRGGGPDFVDSTGRGDDGGPFVVQPQTNGVTGSSTFGPPKGRGW